MFQYLNQITAGYYNTYNTGHRTWDDNYVRTVQPVVVIWLNFTFKYDYPDFQLDKKKCITTPFVKNNIN